MLPHYIAYNPLFAELLHKSAHLEGYIYILFFLFSAVILWQINKNLFGKTYSFIAPLIFLISPWGWYLALAHSFYIFLFFLTLIIIHGIILIRSGKIIPGSVLVTFGSIIAIYSSSLFLIFIPVAFTILIISKIINFRQFKTSLVILIILTLPLFFLINKNKSEFKNSLSRDVKIFSDPSLLNSINRFQGAASQVGLRSLSRISENKYLFFTEYSLMKYVTQLMPKIFFTPEYKLLGFSFNPPIFVGFAIPFVYGLYLALKRPNLRKIIIISSILTIPSILANEQVALNRLILFSPVIFLLIAHGLVELYKKRKTVTTRNFLALTLILVIFQLFVTIGDIRNRDGKRYEKYYEGRYEITEP